MVLVRKLKGRKEGRTDGKRKEGGRRKGGRDSRKSENVIRGLTSASVKWKPGGKKWLKEKRTKRIKIKERKNRKEII